jgi:ribosomal protein S18 acetylase RimI-like enzyme
VFKDSVLAGFISFKRNDGRVPRDYSPSLYLSAVAVKESYRRQGIARKMYKRLFEEAEERGVKTVATRTWETNESHINLLQSLDFSKIKTVAEDRENSIDTIYFAKKFE